MSRTKQAILDRQVSAGFKQSIMSGRHPLCERTTEETLSPGVVTHLPTSHHLISFLPYIL